MEEDEKIPTFANILIVDDVLDNLKVLGNILKTDGHKVRSVLNGAMALQVAAKEKPDLVLLDIMMPGMDGFDVCGRFKANPALNDVPIIFISALNDTDDIVKALKSGGSDYITKPFKAEEVKARVATQLMIYGQNKKLQQQRKELLELNATKDKFFSIIAHDLRGPLGGLMGLAGLMADESQQFTDLEQKEMITDLSHSARNMYNLLENLLEWAQMQKGQTAFRPRKLNLKEVVTDCLRTATGSARKKEIGITTDIPIEYEVFADKEMLQAIIRNLVSNAIKFTHKGGKVAISAGSKDDEKIVISVLDKGVGMSDEMLTNLFRIDTNTRRPGTEGELSTGLGLLLCKEFVEKSGGNIWAESAQQKGSTFYFTIPRANYVDEKEAIEDVIVVQEKGNRAKKIKILIAEDDKTSESIIASFVKLLSKEVLKVRTGTGAVEACRNNLDIDLVLMDIAMPDMDGFEATRLIREFDTHVVIIAQSANSVGYFREQAISMGCDDFMSKPIERGDLVGLIKKYFPALDEGLWYGLPIIGSAEK